MTALKTVSMYLRAAKTDAEEAGESTDGMANSVSELREELLALTGNKVDIQINENTFKSTYQILKELSIVWGELSDVSQANILEMVGGKRNSNVVAALLENFSVADKAIETSANSAGSAAKENEKVLESIQGKLNIMKATFETFSQNFITGDLVKSIIDIVTALIKLSDTIIKIVNVFGGLKNVLIIVGSAFLSLKSHLIAIIAVKIMKFFTGLKNGIMTIVNIIPKAIAAWQSYAASTVSANEAIQASIPVIGLVIATITILIQAIDWLTVSSKEAIEAAEEINSKFQEQQNTLANNKKTIDSISSDYEKLSKGVSDMGTNISLSTEEYSRYNDIVNQIADMFPTMVKGYTAEGNAIIAHKGNVEELTKAYKEQAKAARDGLISKGDDIFSGAEAELDQLNEKIKTNEAAQWLLTGAKVYHGVDAAKNPFSSDIIQKAEKLLKEQGIERQTQRYANGATEETYALIRPYNPKTQSYDDPLPEDVEVRAEKRNNLERDYNLLLAQRDGILSKTNSVIQAYLENEITYENQNEDIKNFISMVSSSLDPSNFDFDDDKMKAWIKNNVLIPISEASPETKKAIEDLFSLDKTKMSAAEWEKQVNDLINQIVNSLTFDSDEDKNVFVKQLKTHLGFEFTTDGETSVGTMLDGVKEKVQDEFDSEVDKLSFDELQIAYNIIAELPEGELLTWDELKEKIDAATQSSNKMTVSLSEMKAASDNLSSISSAFKQLSDDGYMSTESMSKIKEATKLSDEEWDNYQKTLLKVKTGTEDCNQVMSDLIYKILDATFKKDGIVDATEDEVAAVLRENNVNNASAVAHDYVSNSVTSEAKAKAQNAIETAKMNGGISSLINNLQSEADSCGMTANALGDLVAQEIIFNNNNLSVSGKISALASLEAQIYGTAGAYAALHNAMMNGTTSTALLMDRGVKVTSTYKGDSSVPEYMRSANAYDYTYTLNGVAYDNETDAWNAYLSSIWDKQKDENIEKTRVSITPSGGSSGGGGGSGGGSGSDSNEALDNYLKYVKHKKALGYYDDNTAQYINDLQYALNNLTKTEEEQWDLEEQIYSERENLREEEVSGYESWMSHLESLGYYEDDIAKKINDITWAIENQKLTEEEKFKKEEEIYKLTLDRNEKIRESFENLAKAHSETYNYALSDVERYIEQLEHQKALTDDEALIKSIDRAIINSMADGITKAEEAINNLTIDADYWKGEIEKKLKELGVNFDISKWFDYEGNITSQFESDMDVLNNSEAENVISSWANIVSEKLKSVADNTNQTFEYQEKIFSDSKEAIEESISDIKEAAEEIFELRTSKLNSQSTLLKAQHSLINSIAETQHQLDKDILEAETSGARMSERERELLFTRDEYNKLSGKLNDVLSEANDIQDEFNRKLKGATLDTIDEITNHYERQYELKMKEYEIVKAELDVAKAQQKLENVENEKSVRQWDGEKWIYTSVLQDVIDAQNELADAKYALAQAEIEQSQTEAIQEIDSKVDSLETQKNLFITALEGLTEGTTSATERLNTALNEIADTDVSLFRNIVSRVGETLDELGAKISSISIGTPIGSSGGVKVVSGTGNGGIHPVDANLASWGNLKNAYAKGSRHTPKGIGLFDEDNLGSEVLVTKDGVLRQFNAGDTVFNSEMVQRLWDFASGNPIQWNLPNTNAYDISSYISRPEMAQPVYDNRTYFNGIEINDADGIRIMKEFATYLKSKV